MSYDLRNFLRACLLLLLAERPDHGYGLITRLPMLGVGDGNCGRVYRTLREFEKTGLVVSGWKASRYGPARRIYRLTDSGHAALHVTAAALRQTRDTIDAYLDRHLAVPVGAAGLVAPTAEGRPAPFPTASLATASPAAATIPRRIPVGATSGR